MLKIEITGGPGTGKQMLSNQIREWLQADPFYNHPDAPACTVAIQMLGVDGSLKVEGPIDATYQIFVHELGERPAQEPELVKPEPIPVVQNSKLTLR